MVLLGTKPGIGGTLRGKRWALFDGHWSQCHKCAKEELGGGECTVPVVPKTCPLLPTEQGQGVPPTDSSRHFPHKVTSGT